MIFIPALNEGRRIGKVLDEIISLGIGDILVVDDGSDDNTFEEVSKRNLFCLKHAFNLGVGAATQTAIEFARQHKYDAMLSIDADGQHFTEDLLALINHWQKHEVNLLIGSRFINKQNNIPKERVFYNRLANFITFLFCGRWISDTQSGIKLMDQKTLKTVSLKLHGFEFCTELVIKSVKNHLILEEIPVKVNYPKEIRNKGQSLLTGVQTMVNIMYGFLTHY